jgi:sterol desaturase/sphingolipid hydroxylase (fatty acid hydroxylase superfamily)
MEKAQVWIMVVLVAVLLAEIAAGRHRNIYKANDYLVNGLCIVLGLSLRPLLALGVALSIANLLPQARGALHSEPFWQAFIVIVLTAEFCNYWVHRFSHEMRRNRFLSWLWPMHRTHHSGKYVNVLLHFRLNLFWGLVSPLTWVHSLAYYLGQESAAAASIIIFSTWGVFTHSHFRWDDTLRSHRLIGPLFRAAEHVIVSPGIHHTHHGYGRDGKNYRNFGVLLSVFDWIFGTLHIPEGRPAHYGLPGPTPHWAEEIFYPIYRSKSSRIERGESV